MRPRPSIHASFFNSLGDGNVPQTNRHPKGTTRSASPAPFRAPAAMSSKVRIKRDILSATRCLRFHQRRIPAPEAVVGQMRAAPPAVDRVVAGKVLLVSDNGLAEIGEREAAALVGPAAVAIIVSTKC